MNTEIVIISNIFITNFISQWRIRIKSQFRDWLVNFYLKLKPENIFIHSDEHVGIKIGRATNGAHLDIIYYNSNEDQMESTIMTINKHGKFFHFSDEDFKKDLQLG